MYEDIHIPKGLPDREPALLWAGVLAAFVDAGLAVAVILGYMDASVAAQLGAVITGLLGALGGVLRGQVFSPATVEGIDAHAYDEGYRDGRRRPLDLPDPGDRPDGYGVTITYDGPKVDPVKIAEATKNKLRGKGR